MARLLDQIYSHGMGKLLIPFYETRLRGRNTFRYRDDFEANQWLPTREIADLQWTKLRALLEHAYRTVDYYRNAFDAAGLTPEQIRTPADLARLPILDKADIRAHRDRLISSAFRREDLIASGTGGSTGQPLQFFYDRDSYERRTAAAMRGDSWAGWRLCAPEFYLWGAQLLPQNPLRAWKKRLHHLALRRSVVSTFKLSGDRIESVVRRYNRTQPEVVIGYAHAIYEFARYALKAGLTLHRPQGVISSAEMLYDYQREVIEEAFGARVFNRYGCREVMMIAAECDRHQGMHVTADNIYVEIEKDGRPCEPGELGEVLLTDLHNYGMPFIRYRVGDVASWKEGRCACGRGLPLMNVVEGRTLDLISTPGGRVVSGLFFPHLLKDFDEIRTYQIVQEQLDRIAIRVALDAPIDASRSRLLKETVAETLGPEIRIDWEIGEDVVIEQTRKFRPVISRVPVEMTAAGRK